MRLAIFGLSITSAWGNGHATTYRALLRALAARGHEITFFERDRPFYAARRDFRRLPFARVVLYRDWDRVRDFALACAGQCDAVITTSFCAEGARLQRDLFDLRRPRQVFYDLDTPVTMEGLEQASPVTLDYLVPGHIPRFDLYLSFTGGRLLEELRHRWGARQAEPLYLCVDPAAHCRGHGAAAQYHARLSCLATYAPDRQAAFDELFLRPARLLPQHRFTLAGPMYPREMDWPANLARWSHLGPGRHSAFYGASRFTLNLTRAAMRRAGFSPQGRIFEAACCGTPVMSDEWLGLETFFEPQREILVVRHADDVCRGLRDWSVHRRAQLAWRARRRVLADHSADRRARQLESLLLAA